MHFASKVRQQSTLRHLIMCPFQDIGYGTLVSPKHWKVKNLILHICNHKLQYATKIEQACLALDPLEDADLSGEIFLYLTYSDICTLCTSRN